MFKNNRILINFILENIQTEQCRCTNNIYKFLSLTRKTTIINLSQTIFSWIRKCTEQDLFTFWDLAVTQIFYHDKKI